MMSNHDDKLTDIPQMIPERDELDSYRRQRIEPPEARKPAKPARAAPAAKGPWLWQAAATNTAFAGPWGVSYAANLTPDTHTGLGIWTEDIFVKAIRTGKHFGTSRPIQPPMPWPAFVWQPDRTIASLSMIRDCSGRCSPTSIPGTFVAIGRNSPRNSAGASGFRSYMSRWLGPPACQVFQEAEEGAFPVIQRHIIHVLEQSWVFESSQLGVHISATQDDDGRW